MAWIKTVDETEAEGNLHSIYAGLRKQMGGVPNILKVFSLQPETMRVTAMIFQTLMYGPGPLSRAQREMIALVVSAINHCHY